MTVGRGKEAPAKIPRKPSRVYIRRALEQLVDLDAPEELGLERLGVLERSTAGTSRGRRAGRRAGPRPTPTAATPPGPAARAARPGSRRGRTRRRSGIAGGRAPRSGSGRRGRRRVTWRIARATESGSNSTPTRSVVREPLGDRDQPPAAAARDVEDTAAGGQAGGEVGQLGEALLEEDRDVLDRHGLDRAVEPRRTLVDRLAGPEEVRQRGVVEARDDGGDELAAEVLRLACRRAAPTPTSVAERHPFPVELDDLAGVGRPDPGLDRRRRDSLRPSPDRMGRSPPPAARIFSNSPSSRPR